jgi:hypothetical protein
MDGRVDGGKRLNPPGRRGTPRMTVPAQRAGREPNSPNGDGRPPVGIRTARRSRESLAFCESVTGREEDRHSFQNAIYHAGRNARGRGIRGVFQLGSYEDPSERSKSPSGILVVIVVESVVCTLGVYRVSTVP